MKTNAPLLAPPDRADASSAAELHVVLAYESLSAALRAAETLTVLRREAPAGLAVHLSPWSFGTLENPHWRAVAADDVGRADLMFVASCAAPRPLSAVVEYWVKTCLDKRNVSHFAVAALFSHADRPDSASSPRLQSVLRLAKEAGCAFFAPDVTEGIAGLSIHQSVRAHASIAHWRRAGSLLIDLPGQTTVSRTHAVSG